MGTHDSDKVRVQCRAQNHPIDWHWADGRPRRTCGFCGDVLDHTQCRDNCLASDNPGDSVTRPVVRSGS